MRKAPNTNKLKYVGAALLEGESVTLIQAARLVLEIKEALGDEICTITRCREVVSLGLNAIKNKHHTVSFGTAAVECLRSKSHRRPRTLTDIRSIIHKLKKSNPELEHTPLRNLSVEECQSILMNTFTTSRQRHKARLILSGIFSFSVKRGWCDENPILRVDTPFLREQEIPALTLKEVTQLLKACMDEFDGSCVAGAALMIFAGIRPQEVERLLWENIAIRDGCVILNSKHTKTGGARHVTILPVLAKWLKFCRDKSKPGPGTPICPKGWTIKWRKIRKKAGWGGRKKSWVPDCLRHTYASYHAKHFKDYNLLQMEMGHRSSSLLRTRYLNMKGISPQTATHNCTLLLPRLHRNRRKNRRRPDGQREKRFGTEGPFPCRGMEKRPFPTARNRYIRSGRNGTLPEPSGVLTAIFSRRLRPVPQTCGTC